MREEVITGDGLRTHSAALGDGSGNAQFATRSVGLGTSSCPSKFKRRKMGPKTRDL